MSRRFVIRLGLALAALAVCAWFALGIRESHAIDAATAIVSAGNRLTAPQAARADSLLGEARFLNPDVQVYILRARVIAERGHTPEADRILERVADGEPMNLNAWSWLGQLAANKAVLDLAYSHLAVLLPPVPKQR